MCILCIPFPIHCLFILITIKKMLLLSAAVWPVSISVACGWLWQLSHCPCLVSWNLTDVTHWELLCLPALIKVSMYSWDCGPQVSRYWYPQYSVSTENDPPSAGRGLHLRQTESQEAEQEGDVECPAGDSQAPHSGRAKLQVQSLPGERRGWRSRPLSD